MRWFWSSSRFLLAAFKVSLSEIILQIYSQRLEKIFFHSFLLRFRSFRCLAMWLSNFWRWWNCSTIILLVVVTKSPFITANNVGKVVVKCVLLTSNLLKCLCLPIQSENHVACNDIRIAWTGVRLVSSRKSMFKWVRLSSGLQLSILGTVFCPLSFGSSSGIGDSLIVRFRQEHVGMADGSRQLVWV